jgi:nucleoside-diphosphate-sugar epimerase
MEAIVRSAKEYAIFRLPQVVGKTHNPNTLTNYLYRQIMSGGNFEVWCHATRNLIDVADVASIANYLIRSSLASGITENIASPFTISVPHLVSIFEYVLGKKANCKFVDAGGSYTVDSTFANDAANQAGVNFDEDYIKKLLKKYYV